MSNNWTSEILIKEEVKEEVDVVECYIEFKEEFKEEPVDEVKEEPIMDTCKNVKNLDEHIDNALETGSLGLAGIIFNMSWLWVLCCTFI